MKQVRRSNEISWKMPSTIGQPCIGIVVVAAGLTFTYQFVQPAPPKSIVLATGQDGGTYEYYGEQFAGTSYLG